MTPKYLGPYKIVGETSYDNYILRNKATNNVEQACVPLHKVKGNEIDQIISHQLVGAGTKFRFRDNITNKEKWSKSKEIDSSKISAYFKTLKLSRISFLVRTIMFLIFVPTVGTRSLPGDFKICNLDNMNQAFDQNVQFHKVYNTLCRPFHTTFAALMMLHALSCFGLSE